MINMDEELLYQTVFRRKSIRKFEPTPLDPGTMEIVRSLILQLKPLVPDIKTEFRFLATDDVKGMFKAEAPHYLALYSDEKVGYEANAGFLLQQMDLFFSAHGIGCCWLGGSKPTRKVSPVAGMEFVIVLAFGRPAEPLQRDSVSDFKRRGLTDISDLKGMDDLLEAARLAPSGVNNQSWYYRGSSDRIDAYYARSMITDQMNRINVGIGVCHLWLSAVHHKKGIEFVIRDPGEGRTPKGYRYLVSAMLH
jgi:nitroreductase